MARYPISHPLLRLKRRLCNHSGHGVHSPFAFFMIHHLIEYRRGVYYKEEELIRKYRKENRPIPLPVLRMLRIAIRLVHTFRVSEVALHLDSIGSLGLQELLSPSFASPTSTDTLQELLPKKAHYRMTICDNVAYIDQYIKQRSRDNAPNEWIVCITPHASKWAHDWLQQIPYGQIFDVADGILVCLHPKLPKLRCKTLLRTTPISKHSNI